MSFPESAAAGETAPSSGETHKPVYVVDGQPIHVSSLHATCQFVCETIRPDRSFYICTLNLDHLVKLRSDEVFRRIYAGADFVTADGFPIVLLAALDGVALHRVTGADLVWPLFALAAERKLSVYLIGPTAETMDLCAARLRAALPKLQIAGSAVAPRNFDPEGEEASRIIRGLSESKAALCIVALGAPRQEIFSAFASRRTKGVAFVPVGAALEFIAATKRRAPEWVRRIGFEWFWRLMAEPRRLSGRYFNCGLLFAGLLLRRGCKPSGKPDTSDGPTFRNCF